MASSMLQHMTRALVSLMPCMLQNHVFMSISLAVVDKFFKHKILLPLHAHLCDREYGPIDVHVSSVCTPSGTYRCHMEAWLVLWQLHSAVTSDLDIQRCRYDIAAVMQASKKRSPSRTTKDVSVKRRLTVWYKKLKSMLSKTKRYVWFRCCSDCS